MKGVVIFDFDGTIADSISESVEVINSLAGDFGFKSVKREEIAFLKSLKPLELISYLEISLFQLPFILRKFRKIMKERLANVKAVKGLREAISDLNLKGYRIIILSSNSLENMRLFFKKNKFTACNELFEDDTVFHKEKKLNKIARMLEKEGFSRSSVIYVGDEVRDIIAAKSASVKSCAVTWGFSTKEALKTVKPDILVSNPRLLEKEIEALHRKIKKV